MISPLQASTLERLARVGQALELAVDQARPEPVAKAIATLAALDARPGTPIPAPAADPWRAALLTLVDQLRGHAVEIDRIVAKHAGEYQILSDLELNVAPLAVKRDDMTDYAAHLVASCDVALRQARML